MSIQSFIRGAPLFHDLYEDEIDAVLKNCQVTQLDPGERLFSEGEPSEDLYLVLSGKIDVVKKGSLIQTLNKGEIMGELILLFEGTRSSDAVAITHADVLVLNYKSILQTYDKNPRAMSIIMLNLSRLLAARLKRVDAELKDLKSAIKKSA